MQPSFITGIIDKYLQQWVNMEMNKLPTDIAPEMADRSGPDEEGWTTWYPIASTVTDEDIQELELIIGQNLPASYKIFLKHKHFYELHINEAEFGGHEIREWKANFTEAIYNGWPRHLLVDRGYIPFAKWSDWGALCFNTNINVEDYEYPVVLWDHDAAAEYAPFSDNFKEALIKLDKLNETRRNY